jgi:nucleotide-binding universal stress UspA family protein
LERSNIALSREGASVFFSHAIEGADVALAIAAAAERENCGLILIGTRGRSRSASILLGSVTEKVIQFSSRAVLALRSAESHKNFLQHLFGKDKHEDER